MSRPREPAGSESITRREEREREWVGWVHHDRRNNKNHRRAESWAEAEAEGGREALLTNFSENSYGLGTQRSFWKHGYVFVSAPGRPDSLIQRPWSESDRWEQTGFGANTFESFLCFNKKVYDFVSSLILCRHPRTRMHFSQVCLGATGKVSVGTPCCLALRLFANVCKYNISFKFTQLTNVDLVIWLIQIFCV